jgi:hypothetical protein
MGISLGKRTSSHNMVIEALVISIPWVYIFGNKGFLMQRLKLANSSMEQDKRERERESDMNTIILHYSHEYKYIMNNV